MPTAFSRSTQYRKRKEACSENTPYGPLVKKLKVPLEDGSITTIGLQNPSAMIFNAAVASSAFRELLRKTAEREPPPWYIVLYTDGISPADTMIKHDQRKIDAVYWSIGNFDTLTLCSEEVWFVLFGIRKIIVDKINFGLSHTTRLAFEQEFFNTEGGIIGRPRASSCHSMLATRTASDFT